MNYLIVLFAIIPGYLWHIIYVRRRTWLTLPNSAWKLLLPLVFVTILFSSLNFLAKELDFYPKYLSKSSKRIVEKVNVSLFCDSSKINDCEYKESILAFSFSTLSLFILILVSLELYHLLLIVIENDKDKVLRLLKRFYEIDDKYKERIIIRYQSTVESKMKVLSRYEFYLKVLDFPLKYLRRIMRNIYMLEVREENKFLKKHTHKTVLVSMKSNRVYVGVLIEADLRQRSDDDDSMLLFLSLSGYRDSSGITHFVTDYSETAPPKLVFMREVESISRFLDDKIKHFDEQNSTIHDYRTSERTV